MKVSLPAASPISTWITTSSAPTRTSRLRRLATQSFNATTLPGQFDLNVGHQVFVGQGIPLKSAQMTFAPGDYRLEIKITDKTNSQTITRNVPFTVS